MSCLFDSLSVFVNKSSAELREEIVEFIRRGKELVEGLPTDTLVRFTEGQTLQEYTSRMSTRSAWGGAIEIKAFCELYRKIVVVHFVNKTIEFLPSSKGTKGTRIVKCHIRYTGNHYTPMYSDFFEG